MPKVTQGYLDRQRTRILDAARACFARRGFHATSMDEIIAEAGMSSSTVYRYFPEGKQSLIRAVIDGWVDPVLDWLTALSQAEQVPSVEEVFVGVVRLSWKVKGIEPTGGAESTGGRGRVGLFLDIWAEYSRHPDLRALSAEKYTSVRVEIAGLVRMWQREGRVTDRIGAQEAATLIHNASLGLIAEEVVMDGASVEDTARAIGWLLAP